MPRFLHRLFLLAALLCLPSFAQVGFQLSPVAHQQFTDKNGAPLAGGFVFTYSAGSTTPLATYKDNVGTANTNPIVLDAGGFATIYLSQNSYKFVVQNSSSVQQWSQDNIQNFSQIIFTSANTWTLAQTFSTWINFVGGTSDTTANIGNVFYRTDLDRLRWYGGAWHSIIGADTSDTLTNKTLTSPTINTASIVNATSTGTDSGTETLQNKTLGSPRIDRIVAAGAMPACSFASGGGTSPSCALTTNSTDLSGEIVATTGTGSPGASGTVTLTFSAAYGSASTTCSFWAENVNTAWNARVSMLVGPRSTTSSTFTWDNNAVALSTSSAYAIGYSCLGK